MRRTGNYLRALFLRLWIKPWCVANQIRGIEQYLHAELLITERLFGLCIECLSGHSSLEMVNSKRRQCIHIIIIYTITKSMRAL